MTQQVVRMPDTEDQVTELEVKSPLQMEETLDFVEDELKRTIELIDTELATLENRMNATNKLSAVGYQAKASLIGHRLDAARTLANLAFKKKEVELKSKTDPSASKDIVDLLMAGQK